MRTSFVAALLGSALAVMPCTTEPAMAQGHEQVPPAAGPAAADQAMPAYDKAGEMTVVGIVQDVVEAPHCAMMGHPPGGAHHMTMMGGHHPSAMPMAGVHLTLKTGDAVLEIHAGPKAFLSEHGLTLSAGDRLQVVGARATMHGTAVVLVRQVTKAGTTVTVRDESGRPLWRGCPCCGG